MAEISDPPISLEQLFPDEIISEILIRLPVKSIHRFKCVSKHWESIIHTTNFIASYLSLHSPSWVILDRKIRLIDSTESSPTQFHLEYPPDVCYFSIAIHEFAVEPFAPWFPSIVLDSGTGIVLFQIFVKRDPSLYKSVILNGQPYFDSRVHEDTLYVCNPVTGEWVPIPKPPYPVLHGGALGFLTEVGSTPGVLGRFLVVEYQPYCGTDRATLMCFSSETGKWVTKEANYMIDYHQWGCSGGFGFDGHLFFVDDSEGLIIWDDPFGDLEKKGRVECRLISRILNPLSICTFGRYFGVGAGYVHCLEIDELDGCQKLNLYRLVDYQGDDPFEQWSLVHRVIFTDLWADESYMACGLDQVRPKFCFFHPCESDVLFFHIEGRIFSWNVRTRKVGMCGDGYSSVIEHVYLMSYGLPCWPTALPPSLTSSRAKEQGNLYFNDKKFKEAIICYTRSIALSKSAEAYANRAMAYLKLSRFHEAEDDCTEALKLDPQYMKAYARRAIAKKELGDLEGYVKDVESALELEPHNKTLNEQYSEMKSLLGKVALPVETAPLPPVHNDPAIIQAIEQKLNLNMHGGGASNK